MTNTAMSVAEVVTSGLCIGCGLCEALTDGRVSMKMTAYGSLRPSPSDGFSLDEELKVLAACPGVIAEPAEKENAETDDIWGTFSAMRYAWAGDPDLRFKSATGGVLSALGAHLVRTEKVKFVLHVAADPEQPMRSKWVFSETAEEVITRSGSRYGPVAPLAGLIKALDREEPFALIAKPCDVGAVLQYAKLDARVDKFCTMRMVMVCGGQSRLTKSQALLGEFGTTEQQLTLFRYRGYGNPGRTRIETKDGSAFEKTYGELWEDEAGWELETRCKLCPDALGEAADIAAADVWPGGGPTGEDAGFNGVIVRSPQAAELLAAATDLGDIVLGDDISPETFNDFQPHQVRKKLALGARLEGRTDVGLPVINTPNLRLDKNGDKLTDEQRDYQKEGARKRAREGRFAEPQS